MTNNYKNDDKSIVTTAIIVLRMMITNKNNISMANGGN